MKAILIARVSTEEQREAGNSLPAQVERLKNYCQRRGFNVIKTCSFDESAYKDERDKFSQIIDLILEQKEKVVVCCDKVDRLSRNVFDKRIAMLYEKALKDEIELHFVSEGQVVDKNVSAAEQFQFSISLGLAKYYSDAISDNVKRAIEGKLRKGEWIAKAPYGYKNIVREDGIKDVVLDEHGAYIVRKMFDLYATGSFSFYLLSKKINKEHGINMSRGWLAKILKNPFYCGQMLMKGKKYPHRYPPIVPQTVFDDVQKVKKRIKKEHPKYAGLPYIYRGLLRCAHCGLTITPEKHKGLVYYHCTQHNGHHGAKWLREEEITRQIGEVFKNMKLPEEILEELLETLNEVHQNKIDFHNKEFEKITREQKTITKMLDNLYLDKLKGSITDAQYDKFYQSFKDQTQELETRLERLKEAEDNYFITAKSILDLTSRAYELFESSEMEERKQLITLVLSNLRIENDKVLYDVQKPFDLIVKANVCKRWRPAVDYLRTFILQKSRCFLIKQLLFG